MERDHLLPSTTNKKKITKGLKGKNEQEKFPNLVARWSVPFHYNSNCTCTPTKTTKTKKKNNRGEKITTTLGLQITDRRRQQQQDREREKLTIKFKFAAIASTVGATFSYTFNTQSPQPNIFISPIIPWSLYKFGIKIRRFHSNYT